MLKKRSPLSYKQECAFRILKKKLIEPPILRTYDPKLETHITTDASGHAIGAILTQLDENKIERVIAYESRKLTPAEQNYPVYEQELLAIVHALRIWRCYVEGIQFTIKTKAANSVKFIITTDHHSLQHLLTQKHLTRRHIRWIEELQQYSFEIKYTSGSTNKAADSVSRIKHQQNNDDKDLEDDLPKGPALLLTDVFDFELDWPTHVATYMSDKYINEQITDKQKKIEKNPYYTKR